MKQQASGYLSFRSAIFWEYNQMHTLHVNWFNPPWSLQSSSPEFSKASLVKPNKWVSRKKHTSKVTLGLLLLKLCPILPCTVHITCHSLSWYSLYNKIGLSWSYLYFYGCCPLCVSPLPLANDLKSIPAALNFAPNDITNPFQSENQICFRNLKLVGGFGILIMALLAKPSSHLIYGNWVAWSPQKKSQQTSFLGGFAHQHSNNNIAISCVDERNRTNPLTLVDSPHRISEPSAVPLRSYSIMFIQLGFHRK